MATVPDEIPRPGDDIDRLALRISLADIDEQFEKILQKSLVFILKYLSKYEDHRKKLMELLGDVTRRLKCRPNIQVPVHELFLSYNDPLNSVFLVNFSHMYIRLGFPRLPLQQKIKLLPVLFASLSDEKPVCQRDGLLHLTLPVVESLTNELAPRDLCFNELPYQRRYISDFFSLVMLLPYNFQRLIRSDRNDPTLPDGYNSYDLGRVLHDRFTCITSAEDLEKLQSQLQLVSHGLPFETATEVIPNANYFLIHPNDHQLSFTFVTMCSDMIMSNNLCSKRHQFKVGIVTFYTRHFFPAEESIIPVLFGYGDSRHSVVSVAAKELRTLSILVDWEDESLLNRLLAWYLGRRREFDPKGRNEARRPLSPNMRIKLGHYLMRSRITFPGPLASSLVEAAMLALEPNSSSQSNILPNSGQRGPPNCIHTPIENGPASDADSGTQLQTSGRTQTEESVPANTPTNALGPCSSNSVIQQRRLAEHGLDLLSHLINNVTTLTGSASIAALRCLINFVYERTADELIYVRARGFEILSRFLARDPNYILKDPAQLPRLFDVLSEDNPAELKLAAAHCLRRLAVSLHGAQKQNYSAIRGQLVKLERLLYENIEKPDPLSRLVAVNFAGLIYPSDHIPTRYLILQALGDKDPRVRTEACMAFEQFLDPNIIHDIVYGRVKLPSFVEFVNHDTQHSRKNPFVEVERLIPVVQFIRLCLLATRGGLTPAQEAGLTYETEEEVRYLINQTVRYFLSAGNSTTTISQIPLAMNNASATNSANSTATPVSTGSNVPVINPEQAKRSIDTYFRLIQVVIFTRSQHTKDSPDFPNYLEEVLVGNTKELITCNKQLFDRMNSVLLATPRGASCRHACASVYSVVVMETETPAQALQTAKGMLAALPNPGAVVDGESSHAVQGMFMGAAYLLERLFTAHVVPLNSSGMVSKNNKQSSTEQTKKGKKEKQQSQKNLQTDIIQTIEELLSLMDAFLVKPNQLVDSLKTNTKNTLANDGFCYVNSSVAQATVVALLEALVVIGRAGCLSHLPVGTLPITGNNTSVSLLTSKAAFVHRIVSYLPTSSEERSSSVRYPRVSQAALRTLAAICMGEGYQTTKDEVSNSSGNKSVENLRPNCHPHTIPIMKVMVETAEINDSSLHLAVGTALADCILGPISPYRFHWYERNYPLIIPTDALNVAVTGPVGQWLAEQLRSLLTRRPGQVQTRPVTIAATLWILNLVRRLGPLPKSLLSYQLLIDLLDEKDESVQCVAVATLGLIYDRSSEEERSELIASLTKAVGNDKKSGSPIYRELCTLTQQIGRPDLALSLIVLAIALPSATRSNSTSANAQSGSCFSNIAFNLSSSITYSSLVRRLGRSLAPALPRLVPRIFVRRFDFARPKLRQAMENVWLGLVLYATNSATPYLSSNNAYANLNLNASSTTGTTTSPTNQNAQLSSSPVPNSVHSLVSEMIEAHFNAIVCEIKTQLGFNTLSFHATQLSPNSPQSSANASGTSGAAVKATSNTNSPGCGTGTQNMQLRDACCLAITSLATHPSADKRLAGHLPALLSGLLSLCDESESSDVFENDNSGVTTPAEEAAITVQKLVIRVLENPCSREAATGLLPGLLPVIIERAPWSLSAETASNKSGRQPPSELRRLALELLLAAARTARPSALRPALPQLVLSGLQAMSSIHPSVVANLMRQPIHHLHLYSQATPNSLNIATSSSGLSTSSAQTNLSTQHPVLNTTSTCKEVQMAEVLRLCVRLLDDICLSRLIVPFTELIKAGGGSSTASISGSSATGGSRGTGASGSASIATAACVFINHLAVANTNALAVSSKTTTCLRCAASRSQPTTNGVDNPPGSPIHKTYNSPPGSSHSSPSSFYGVSPPTPPSGSAYEVSPHSVSSGAIDLPTSGNRSRAMLHGQKHTSITNGASGTADGTGSCPSNQVNPVCCNATGGGFASLAPHTGKLLAALLSAIPGACRHPNSAGKIIQEEMARTLASLLRFAKDTSVTKVFNRVRSWYLQPEQDTTSSDGGVHADSAISISHWACARVLHAVAHQCTDFLYAHAGITLPLIFLSKQVESEAEKLASFKTSSVMFHPNNRSPDMNTVSASYLETNTNISISTREKTLVNANQNDSKVYQQLWQECWEELISRLPSTPCSPQSVVFLPNAVTLGLKSLLPLSSGLANSFLRRPLLDHCTQLLYDALLESPSWTVHNQASFAILQLATRMIGQPFSTTCSNNGMNKRTRCYARPCPKAIQHYTVAETSPGNVKNADSVKSSNGTPDSEGKQCSHPNKCISADADEVEVQEILEQQILDLEENEGMTDEDDEFSDDEEDEDEVVVVKEESAVHAWFVLVQITCTALNKCKPWPGKVYLLRAARALSEFALEQRSIIEELADQDVIHQMWCALERETRPRRAEGIGLGYQAEAFLTFASFNEACFRNAITVNHTCSTTDRNPDENATTESHHESVDHLSELFVLIVPQWLKRGKNSTQNKNSENLRLNTKLNDFELGQAVRAVGIIWPLNVTKEDLPRFTEIMTLLNTVMTQSGKLVQVACLASALAVLAKLNPEQSAQIVESTGKSASKSFSELGLKELLGKVKRSAENQKSQLLREHALGTIAGLLRHPSFTNLCRESIRQLLISLANDKVQALRDWASELIKTL